jgi:tRNA threonylcarbamoyladenosine biosynthesis protein TsaB
MATILCIETATTNCSVALSIHGSVTFFKETNPTNIKAKGFSHAEILHQFIETVLTEAKVNKTDLDAIAVSKGPGSYTGLRIGVSAAKGLCFALDIPLISVPTLTSLASKIQNATVIPMLDARRMEVYAAVFSSTMKQVQETSAIILDAHSFSTYLSRGVVYFIGDGVAKFQDICQDSNAIFEPNALPSAIEMGPISEMKFQNNAFEDVAYFEPFYLKDFIAH